MTIDLESLSNHQVVTRLIKKSPVSRSVLFMGTTVNSIIILLHRKDFTGLRTFLFDILVKENNSKFSNFDENYPFLHVNLEDCLKRIVNSLPSFILTAVSQDTLEINNLISIINSLEAENTSLKQFTDTDPPQLTISRPNQFGLSTIERTIL
jgi:hypothetical protein